MKALARRLRSLARLPKEEAVLKSIAIGEELENVLLDSHQFAQACRSLAAIAKDRGCGRMVGASPLGERLAGGSVLALTRVGGHPESKGVLVVDGLFVTGAQVSRARDALAGNGRPSRVEVAVLLAAPPTNEDDSSFGDVSVVHR